MTFLSQPKIALVYSVNDIAGSSVAKLLRDLLGSEKAVCPGWPVECYVVANNVRLAGYKEESIYFDFLDESPDPRADVIIVLSRHSAKSGKPSLTVHHTGNPTKDNSYGGEPYTLSISVPPLSKTLLKTYRQKAEEHNLLGKYELTLEVTHHGPTKPRKPLVFIEIGSSINEWRDTKAQYTMAETIIHVLEKGIDLNCEAAAGFGGSHYPEKFTRLHLESDMCFGHIIPKYAFNQGVNVEVVLQAIRNTWPAQASVAVIEKKSIKSTHRSMVENTVKKLGIKVRMV